MTSTLVDWRRLAALVGVVIAVLALYWPATHSLGALWLDGPRRNYTHGFLVLAISLWLMWRSRAGLARQDPHSMPASWRTVILMVILAIALCWQFAYRAGIQLGVEFLLLPLIWLTVLMVFGRCTARAMFLPVAYLGFAMTFWDFLNPLAQSSSVHAVRLMLRLVGVPAHFFGNVVEIPAGAFEIQGGCSGLHFIIVGLAVAVLIGELRGDDWRMRLRWLLIAGVLAVLANWIRVFTVILSGHLTHMQHYLVTTSHYGFGWVLFAGALLVFFLIERRTPLRPLSEASSSIGGGNSVPASRSGALAPWVASTALLLALPLVQNFLIDSRLESLRAVESSVEHATRGAWKLAETAASDWQPIQLHADREQRLRFVRGEHEVEVYRAQYFEQRQGKELGGYSNHMQGDSRVLDEGNLEMGANGFTWMIIEKNGRRSVLWITYRVGGRGFASPTRAQLWYSWLTMSSMHSAESEAVALRAVCDGVDCGGAKAQLEKFISDGEGVP